MAKPKDGIPLSPEALARVRAGLATASGKRRLDLILDQPDPGAVVRALPADDLFLTIREIGLGDAVELVELASAGQFRTFLDLACWRGDRAAPRSALPWLRAARAGSMDSPRAERRWKAKVAGLDVELVYLLLRETLRVHDLEEDPDPDFTSDRFLRTPENRFVIEFLADGAEYMAVRGLVDDLYAEDPFKASRLLSSIRWELPSELEETALRWRTARLADLGYPTREEALSWFARPVAGPTAPAGLPARPPGFYLERIGTGSLLARAAAGLDGEAREHLELELVAAANAALVADAVDPGDLDAVRQAVEASRVLVEMGLEEEVAGPSEQAAPPVAGPQRVGRRAVNERGACGSADGEAPTASPAEGGEGSPGIDELAEAPDARAAEILLRTPVKSLFQRGFGRTLALKWRAEKLLAPGRAGSRAAPLLDPPLGEALTALARPRPLYFPGLEAPRDEWGADVAAAFEPRPFRSSSELVRTAEALALAEGLASLARHLGFDPAPAAPAPGAGALAPRLSALYLTALANERLGRGFAPEPLAREDVPAAARALAELTDARLASQGDAGRLLADLARARAGELAMLRDGAVPDPGQVASLLVKD
jgi:hypothetical protein